MTRLFGHHDFAIRIEAIPQAIRMTLVSQQVAPSSAKVASVLDRPRGKPQPRTPAYLSMAKTGTFEY